ncbi:MAG: cell division protein CrgA [Actinomycetota bacterium]|nr:cell division protein CrgA [Acidothermales bacterium]MDQ3431889.1 cell division protein CrgA [Actinomycetota bacterium]
MPRSRLRRKSDYTPPAASTGDGLPGRAWVAPVMVTLFLLGLLWIVVFYITQGNLPISPLGNWNLIIGFGFIIAGFVLSTQWR